MDFFDFFNISERDIELINPISPDKVLALGSVLGLREGTRVIDFGTGYGEVLVLWAESFGITGVGIEIREHACQRAKSKIARRKLEDRLEIICGDAAKYVYKEQSYDIAACIGASFIWGGFRETILGMRSAIGKSGNLLIGEPYWLRDRVPPEYFSDQYDIHSEYELLRISRQEGFDIQHIVRASHDDWDGYMNGNWRGLLRWLEENPDHPERAQVRNHFLNDQDEYFRYGREYLGWAIYLLTPSAG